MSARFDLREARVNAGLSQRQLADELEVSREAIRRIEDGEGSARPATLLKIATRFGVQVTDLLDGNGDDEPTEVAA
jgi:transcriptional regulator with XRE-family HTH domain